MKGLGSKPIVVLNHDGFYDGFIAQLKRAGSENLLYDKVEEYFSVASTPEEAVRQVEDCISNGKVSGMAEKRVAQPSAAGFIETSTLMHVALGVCIGFLISTRFGRQ